MYDFTVASLYATHAEQRHAVIGYQIRELLLCRSSSVAVAPSRDEGLRAAGLKHEGDGQNARRHDRENEAEHFSPRPHKKSV